MIEPIRWIEDRVQILDQTLLPAEIHFIECKDYRKIVDAIRTMKIRGAPAIGVIAAYGIALGAQTIKDSIKKEFLTELSHIIEALSSTRPTAINLFRSVERMKAVAQRNEDIPKIVLGQIGEYFNLLSGI